MKYTSKEIIHAARVAGITSQDIINGIRRLGFHHVAENTHVDHATRWGVTDFIQKSPQVFDDPKHFNFLADLEQQVRNCRNTYKVGTVLQCINGLEFIVRDLTMFEVVDDCIEYGGIIVVFKGRDIVQERG